MSFPSNFGFIQGRLSEQVDGKIQAFPARYWRDEFKVAHRMGLSLMEWTLDYENLYSNPFMTKTGQAEILDLCEEFSLSIPSLTGDCFMQAPFYKYEGAKKNDLEKIFIDVAAACDTLNVDYIVFPLVDNGSLTSIEMEDEFIEKMISFYQKYKFKVKTVFESDYTPNELKRFIDRLPDSFGINYDTGNSAALGYKPNEEFASYGKRILNIHIKDRVLNGTTVPLGQGDTDFNQISKEIKTLDYKGNFIFQTARSKDGNHESVLRQYCEFIKEVLA